MGGRERQRECPSCTEYKILITYRKLSALNHKLEMNFEFGSIAIVLFIHYCVLDAGWVYISIGVYFDHIEWDDGINLRWILIESKQMKNGGTLFQSKVLLIIPIIFGLF